VKVKRGEGEEGRRKVIRKTGNQEGGYQDDRISGKEVSNLWLHSGFA